MKETAMYLAVIIVICTLVGVTITSFTQCEMAKNKQVNDYMIECVKIKSPLECSAANKIIQRNP